MAPAHRILEGFKRFCELVLSEEDKEIRRHSFEVAIRHLRTGALLLNPKRPTSRWLLYCYDYDELVVEGSYSPSIRKQKSFTGGILGETEVVARQTPVGANGSHFRNVDEFLIGDPWKRTGRVRWVHAVSPDLECLLALGQQYQLRVHAQLLLCRLDSAQPQAEVSRNRKDWSSVVFPAAYIDDDSRRSFDRYKAWYQRVASDAKELKLPGSGGNQTWQRRQQAHQLPRDLAMLSLRSLQKPSPQKARGWRRAAGPEYPPPARHRTPTADRRAPRPDMAESSRAAAASQR